MGTVVDTPIRAHLAAVVNRPLHLDIACGTGVTRSRQEVAHQPAASIGAILRGVSAGHSRGSQHLLSSRLAVTPFVSFTCLCP